MTIETEQWLSPMVGALLSSRAGGELFVGLMESAMPRIAVGARGVDWIDFGQRLRQELCWDDYPALPPHIVN